jgi:hypothetical protein
MPILVLQAPGLCRTGTTSPDKPSTTRFRLWRFQAILGTMQHLVSPATLLFLTLASIPAQAQ